MEDGNGAGGYGVEQSGDVPVDAPVGCPGTESSHAGKAATCVGCPNQAMCASGEAKGVVDSDQALIAERLGASQVRRKILVMSGKGGVGKSTFAAQFAFALAAGSGDGDDVKDGHEVGILDADLCGPSIPRLLGVEGQEVRMSRFGWQPVLAQENLAVMSAGFLIGSHNDALIWRGARKTGLIKQLLRDVDWGYLDYLIVDTPPGTSDEHITVVQSMKEAGIDGALIVTTPQEVSLLDVRKELTFCAKAGVRVLGVIENMSGFVCPSCSTCTEIFPPRNADAVQRMCQELLVPYLGKVPLDPRISFSSELGRSVFIDGASSESVQAIRSILTSVVRALTRNGDRPESGTNETDQHT